MFLLNSTQKRKWVLGVALGLLGLASAPCAVPPHLNVLFILVDDLGYMDVSPYNQQTFYDTPSIQRLADSGMRFTHGYAASPVCSPTRSAIFTGQSPARTLNTDYFGAPNGFPDAVPIDYEAERHARFQSHSIDHATRPVWPAPYLARLAASHTTLAEALSNHGYATFFAGKWHLGPEGSWPEDHGFSVNRGGHDRGGPYGGKQYFSPYGNPRLEDGPDGEHLPDRLATETIRFMAAHQEQPFFAFLSFYSVHTPLMGRPDLVEKYDRRKAERKLQDRFGKEHPRQVREVQCHTVYAAMVEAMDLAVGRVLQALDDYKLANRTLVIFTSDNGGLSTSEGSPTSNLPLRAGKGWLYEGGIRVPIIVRWPGVTPPASVSEWPVSSADYYPSILEACGIPLLPEQHRDGNSFIAALTNQPVAPGHALFWHYPHWGNQGGTPGTAVRIDNWKLIHWYWGKEPELYDLATDPGEQQNLAAQSPGKVAQLQERLDAFLAETRAQRPTPNPSLEGDFLRW
jgi:arylsulfatase A-like enzyme